ncbi:MAG: B12-binding domain-containing radical SAM protein [Planctomycetota bacterium]|jgi:radical SAM superfamily enzyme YgiQ (UPF0313 family)
MRVLLINISRPTEVRIPQGLLYLASAVKAAGYSVSIHDEALAPNLTQSFERILAYDADIVGLSVYSLPWQLKRAEDISRFIKINRKSTTIIWGGWHPTLYAKYSILNNDVDIVVRGPGERPLCQLLNAIKKVQSLKDVSALTIKDGNKIIETGPEYLSPEHLFPPLDFQLIELNKYLKRHDAGEGILQYITSRGCHGRCQFCVMSRLFKSHLFRKPKSQIVSELKNLLNDYTISTIRFSDDNSFRNNAEASEFCNIIYSITGNEGIPWRCPTRIDTLGSLSIDTYKKIIASGCQGFAVGIESGVDRVLQLMKKGIRIHQTHRALRYLKNNGLENNLFFFLFGFTGETAKEARKTLKLARETRLTFPYSDIVLYVFFSPMSNPDWLDSTTITDGNLSKVFADYHNGHLKNYCVAGTRIGILQYYFGVTKIRTLNSSTPHNMRFLRSVYSKLILLRIKYGIFILPFEYYLSNVIIRKIRKIFGRK